MTYQLSTPYGVRVTSVQDVAADKFIPAYATHLKQSGQFEVPKWMEHVKTQSSKELGPYDPDFIYLRAASIIRLLYIRPGYGVGQLRKHYGVKARNGAARNHHRDASGKIIRHCIQQLEKMKLLEVSDPSAKTPKSQVRKVSSLGQQSMVTVAKQVGQ